MCDDGFLVFSCLDAVRHSPEDIPEAILVCWRTRPRFKKNQKLQKKPTQVLYEAFPCFFEAFHVFLKRFVFLKRLVVFFEAFYVCLSVSLVFVEAFVFFRSAHSPSFAFKLLVCFDAGFALRGYPEVITYDPK